MRFEVLTDVNIKIDRHHLQEAASPYLRGCMMPYPERPNEEKVQQRYDSETSATRSPLS
jgi:hypothetical protein